jgi:YHS domain-containing protein
METPICPTCGCSLARLGIAPADAARARRGGTEVLFCCDGCRESFEHDPERYLADVADWVVCPACLAEKPKRLTVSVEYDGSPVYLCRYPCCLDAFRKDPEAMLGRLAL